ncbi:MAG: CBS domain-containing protein [Myxococcales bacterium]|nr:CBS domain-containing protein [Myxococcales bacterium]
MNIKIADIMSRVVVTAQLHHTVEHVRGIMDRNGIHAVPIVDTDGHPLGIVSSLDFLGGVKDGVHVGQVMTPDPVVLTAYEDVHVAARVMRNRHIHHVLVTHEQVLVGIISSFDLLKLVEEHRFVMKNPPTTSVRKGNRKA